MNAFSTPGAVPVFHESAIPWLRFGEVEPPIHYRILHIDEALRIADVIFKFPANDQIVLHRHLAPNCTFVVQGEHRVYEADGRLREVRSTGSYTVSAASQEPHREGGGEHPAVVLFSMRAGEDGALYELLDDACNPIGTISFQLLSDLFQAQSARA